MARGNAGRLDEFPGLESPFTTEAFEDREQDRTPVGANLSTPFESAFETSAHETQPAAEGETDERLRSKLRDLVLLPHTVTLSGAEVPLKPVNIDPGIYDGAVKFRIAPRLQACLNAAMENSRLKDIRVALVDLTEGVPEFAGFNHKQQIPAEAPAKLAAMLAAFQLRHDLRMLLKSDADAAKNIGRLFGDVRQTWAAAQMPHGPDAGFAGPITRRGNLVLVNGKAVPLAEPKTPQLENIFRPVAAGDPVTVEFNDSGETTEQWRMLVSAVFSGSDADRAAAAQKVRDLGFAQRLAIMLEASTRVGSNLAAPTVVRDLGYEYIASVLLQYGLFDPNRAGGLWLGSDYDRSDWQGAPASKLTKAEGGAHSATAGSLAAFLTLLARDQLVDRESSAEMSALLKQELSANRDLSGFREGIEKLPGRTSELPTVLSMGGIRGGMADDCGLIERITPSGETLRYVAVGLGATRGVEKPLQELIEALDGCIAANHASPGPAPKHENGEREEKESPFATTFPTAETEDAHELEDEEFEDQLVGPGADNYEGEIGFEHPGPDFQVGPAEQELEALEAREDRDASEDDTPVIIQHDVPKTSTGPRFVPANVEGKASSGHQLFDAFYADERNTIMSRELHPFKCFWNMFTGFNNFRGFDKGYEYTDAVAITWWKDFPNPLLDTKLANILPENSASLPWKDADTIEAFEGKARYYVYIPPALSDDFKSRPKSDKPKAKISLFFGVWTEINSFGLRTYFFKSTDSVLITITSSLWGIGITTQMIRELLDVAGLKDIEFSVEVMAGYSAAYRSLNETVINKLVDLKKLKRLIYLDAFYYHDDFPLAKEGQQFQVLDKNTNKSKNTNTLWAIDTALKESADAELFIYAYSYDGTERTTKRFKKGAPPPRPRVPIDDFMKQRFPKRAMHFIDLEFDPRIRDDKVHKFESICLARLIQSGIDESFEKKNVPANILALVDCLPDRGSLGTWGRTGFLDLFAWVVAGRQKDAIMQFPADQAFKLVARFNLLGDWTPRRAAGPGPEDKKRLIAYGVPEKLVRGYWLRHVDFVQEICKECLLP